MMTEISLLLVTLVCAVQAIRTRSLLEAALWLAVTSALTATTLFALGGQQVAVMELSVGAGLVTVLFVYAISLVGPGDALPPAIPKWLAAGLVGSILILLVRLVWPFGQAFPASAAVSSFAETFWKERQLDTLLQIVVIFTGGMSVIGLLAPHAIKQADIKKEAGTLPAPVSPRPPEPIPLLPEAGVPGEVSA